MTYLAIKEMIIRIYIHSSDPNKMVPVKQHISVRKAVQKFQKTSKIHNLPLYKLLESERELARFEFI